MLLSSLLFIEQPKTLIFIVLILVLFFGAKRIPELMRGLGQGVREFKDASNDFNKAPQTHQPYSPPPQYPQPPYAAQPSYPAQPPVTSPAQPYTSPVASASPDAGSQPLA